VRILFSVKGETPSGKTSNTMTDIQRQEIEIEVQAAKDAAVKAKTELDLALQAVERHAAEGEPLHVAHDAARKAYLAAYERSVHALMAQEGLELPKPVKSKGGWPLGKPRKPRKPRVEAA
jgi:hypothetical protein